MIYANNYDKRISEVAALGKNAPKNMEDMKAIYGDKYSDENQVKKYATDTPTKMYPALEPVHWGFGQHCNLWLYHRELVKKHLGVDLEDFPLEEQWAQIFAAKSANDTAVKSRRWKKPEEEKPEKKEVTEFDRWLDTIPPRFKAASIESFPGTDDIQKHILGGGSLLMVGPTGTKKSSFLWAMAKMIAENIGTNEVEVMNLADILSEVRTSGDDWTNAVKDLFCRKTWLFIDEVDKVLGTESDKTLTFDLIDSRYVKNLPTVCSGNGNIEKIRQKLGEATVSRLVAKNENGMLVTLGGPDMRNK